MRCIVLVNALGDLTPVQTTSMLVAALARRSHHTWVTTVGDLALGADGSLSARAHRAPDAIDTARCVAGLGAAERVELRPGDLLLMRTNPGRDDRAWAHDTALEVALLAQERGVIVVNDPTGLARAGSKLYLGRLPEHIRPRTLVTRDASAITEFIATAPGDVVVKPSRGTRGQDVFRVRRDTDNMRQLVEVLTRQGYAMIQDYVAGAEHGDVRMILLDGEPLRVDGHVACVRRIPPAHDFRSNVAVGGTPAEAPWSSTLAAIATSAGPALVEDGLSLVGLDVIGDRVVEVNVFSPGGLHDANRFYGVDFTTPIVDALEKKQAGG